MGFDIKDIQYLPLADKLGVGSMDVSKADIHEYRAELKEHSLFAPSDASNRLGRNVIADSACSVCYGSLIHALQRLQENEKGRCRKKSASAKGFVVKWEMVSASEAVQLNSQRICMAALQQPEK